MRRWWHSRFGARLGILLAAAALLIPVPGQAEVISWVGATQGTQDWFVTGNWSPSRVPASEDDVRITGAVANLQIAFSRPVIVKSILNDAILRPISDLANHATLEVISGLTNRGEIRLESQRSDRTTTVIIRTNGILENTGRIVAIAANAGGRAIRGSIDNRGFLGSESGILLEIDNRNSQFLQQAGSVRADGSLRITGGRVRFEGGALAGDIRLFNPDLSISDGMGIASEVFVLGDQVRFRGNASAMFAVHATTDLANFTTLRADGGAVNNGRIILSSARTDRSSRIEFGTNFRNSSSGRIEIVQGGGGERSLNGTLVNQGVIACNTVAVFTGTYEAAGGVVEGTVHFLNSTIVPTASTPSVTELLLYGGGSILRGDNPPNLRLRLISDVANFTTLTVGSNTVNQGEILLESASAGRTTRLQVPTGGSLNNRGLLRAAATGGGGRVIAGGVHNAGALRVDPGITLSVENSQSSFLQALGSIQADGTLQIQGGRFRLIAGSLSGLVQCFNVEHYAAPTMTSSARIDVLGSESRLVSNDSTQVTYVVTSDLANFTTLRLLSSGANRGRLLLTAGRSDRGTRLLFDAGATNAPPGRIEVLAGPGGTRAIEGTIVNQGAIVSTNAPAEFRGAYQSDGGTIEGDLQFIGSTIVQTKDAPRPLDFQLYGNTTLTTDNRPRHRLRVISDLARFSTLILASNVANRSLISLESLRSDRTAFLRSLDGIVRNESDGVIIAAPQNEGGREIIGSLQNFGRIQLERSTRIQSPGATHRNGGLILLATNTLDADGASFVNLESGRILGAGVLDVAGVAFTNAGIISIAPAIQRMSVLGNFNQSPSGLLDIDLAGVAGPGLGHDSVEISNGSANLGGRLSVRLAEGFAPAADASFQVLSAQLGVNGRFSALATVQVSSNRFLEAAYSANAVDILTRAGSISNQAPSIAIQPESLNVDPDAAVEFFVAPAGTGPFAYQWRFKGVPIPGATTARFALPKVRWEDAGHYDVVVSSPFGSATSQSARLGVNDTGKTGAPCTNCDFGDGPDAYGTSLARDGARHPNESATGGAYVTLGARVDTEADSPGNATAALDDSRPAGQPDDEDGVVFTLPIQAGQSNELRVAVVKFGFEHAFLNVWMDMGADGVFDSGDDHIIRTREVQSGLNTLRFWVPATAVDGTTVSRFRLVGVNSPQDPRKETGPTGQADNGEVEDHPVTITSNRTPGGETGSTNRWDFGDAPDTYRTTLAANGARHASEFGKTNAPHVILGGLVDLETNGPPTVTALGDDAAIAGQPDDEEGVLFLDPLQPGRSARVQVVVNSGGYSQRFLNAWLDQGIDGAFASPSDKIFSGLPVAAGTNVLTFQVSSNAVVGNTFARFRITGGSDLNSTNRVIDYQGLAPNGEVEDHAVKIREIATDWGDAPEPAGGSFATTRLRNGPRHVIVQGIYLGQSVDPEPDGRPTAQARGDDNNQADDEDGVIFSGPLALGALVNLQVTASAAGKLEGWIDFNRNNSWSDPGENVFNSANLTAGLNTLPIAIPANASAGDAFARFRFSTRGGYGLLGEAADGEVEDYKVSLEQNSSCNLTCEGSDFWIAFPGNQFPDPANPLTARLRILGAPGTAVTVSIPGLGSNIVASVAANGVADVALPAAVDLGNLSDAVLNRGIHVTAAAPVSVYALSHVNFSSDGYLGIPTAALGTDYVVGAYPNLHAGIPELSGTQFAIAATRPNTTVTITPASETGIRVTGIPYSVILTNAGDCYQLRNTNDAPADLSGTLIEADQPVAVFGGHQCTDVNSSSVFFCDYLVEQIPPANRLGAEFFTAPLGARAGGETVRVVASQPLTTLSLDGAPLVVLTNKGDVFTAFLTNAAWITADKPVYAAQYASSSDLDGNTNADPFMVTLPARSQFSSAIAFPTGGTNFGEHYITIFASQLTTSVTLDGVNTSPVFTPIGSSGFHYATLKVSQGVHTITAGRPIGVIVYGWSPYKSYAWPACLFFGDVTPPVVQLPANSVTRSLPAAEGACLVPLPDFRQNATATDNCSLPLDVVFSQSPPAGTLVGVGTNKVVLNTRDSAGNLGNATLDYIVTDPLGGAGAYAIHCPPNIIAPCQTTNGAIVNFNVIGRRGCSPVQVETIPPSGSLFPRGTTEVVARIIADGAIQAECRFAVTISCKRRLELKLPAPEPGNPAIRELRLEFDAASDVVLEVADSLSGPWITIPNPTPGMLIRIGQEKSRFYRIR